MKNPRPHTTEFEAGIVEVELRWALGTGLGLETDCPESHMHDWHLKFLTERCPLAHPQGASLAAVCALSYFGPFCSAVWRKTLPILLWTEVFCL